MSSLHPAYTWNPKVNQYVDAKGRFVPRSDIKSALEGVIDAARAEVDAAARRLQAGEADIDQWFRATAASIKTINVASATLAMGGTHNMTPSALGSVGARVKEQYQYLYQFARELEAGLPLDGDFLARAKSYADSGRPTFEAMARKADIAAGFMFERRYTRPGEHCNGCVHEEGLGWQPAGALLAIGECECLNQCHCYFVRSKTDPEAKAPGKSRKGVKSMSLFNAVASVPWAITEEWLEVIAGIARREGAGPEAVAAKLGRPLDNTQLVTIRDGVATVPITGPIFRHASMFTEVSGARTTAGIATDFRSALDDPAVRAIVLDIDSPGGEAMGIGELGGMIHAARGVKPVTAYISGMGASAAYWIASAADEVVISESSIVGSIGALISYDRREPGDPGPIVIKSVQSPEKYHDPESVKGQSRMQAVANAIGAVFVDDVARNRGVTPDDVMIRYGRGGVMVGKEAVAAGLADRIGSLEGVIAQLSGRAPSATHPHHSAPVAGTNPQRTAMSAENTPAITAAEAADLRKQLAEAKALAESNGLIAARAIDDRIGAAAESFAESFVSGPGPKATPAERERMKADFIIAARDDHDRPIAGTPTARQDALRAAYGARKPHGKTTEQASSDPAEETRALASDPAGQEAKAKDAELQQLDANARKVAKQLNGK